MSQPSSPDELATLNQQLRTEVSVELRSEIEAGFAKIRNEISESKVAQAERHSGYMRNWLGLLTLTITVAFVIFGILGWTRFSDITTERKEMAQEAADTKTLAMDVQSKARIINDSVVSIQNAKARIDDLDARMKTTDANVTAASQRIADIEKRSEDANQRIVAAVNQTSEVALQTSSNFQSSISSGVFGSFPSITSAYFAQEPAQSTIRGIGLGDSPGHVYVEIQHSPFSTAATQLQSPTRLDISPKYTKWANDEIDFILPAADYQAIKDAHAKSMTTSSVTGAEMTISGINFSGGLSTSFLNLIVETSDGRSSLSSPFANSGIVWP
jgi:hypothetical protein